MKRILINKIMLYRNVLRFNKEHRKDYYDILTQLEGVNVVVFKNRKQVKAYLKEVSN